MTFDAVNDKHVQNVLGEHSGQGVKASSGGRETAGEASS